MNNTNPWMGWSSYDDDYITTGKAFVGRTSEISELFSLIDNNLLVTLYGKSGIGKTSLLNAGVFPSLKAADYEPIICRCSETDYFDNIIRQIRTQCSLSLANDISMVSNLVELFKYTEFSKNGKPVFPVLVFDQFEDWFRLNSKCVDDLLREINILTSNEYEGITNYRFVISIREDYLYLLEDAIDKQELNEFKSNRYRLTELKLIQAEEIFDLGEIEGTVRERLLEIAKESNGYNPGLISFFCSELYNLYPKGITSSALKELEDENTLIERYYHRCLEHGQLSKDTKIYIEKNLQDEGLRRPQNLKTVRKYIPEKELSILLNGHNKLLRVFPVGDEEHIELLHDQIATIIQVNLNKRQEEQKTRFIFVSLFSYYIVVAYLMWGTLLKILHASWAVLKSSYTIDYANELIGKEVSYISSVNIKYAIYSQIFASLIFIYFISYSLPKIFCQYFYSTIKINKIIIVCLGIIFSYILCSNWLISLSISINTILFQVFGWILLLVIIIYNLKHTKNEY